MREINIQPRQEGKTLYVKHEEMVAKLQKLVDKWQAASFGNATDPVIIAVKIQLRECSDALANIIGAPHKNEDE